MRNFSNPQPITVDVSFDEPIVAEGQQGLDFVEPGESEEETPEVDLTNPTETPEQVEDIITIDPLTPEEPQVVETTNPYLQTINSFLEKGIFDTENLYEGFTDETEPSEEVLEKFIEHNIQLREQQAVTDLFEEVSPLTQRLLQYDLNAKGQGVDSFIRILIEENNIKSLNPDNEYDQEKIVRTWYKDEDFTSQEIDEKIEDLKQAGLLVKEASRLKPKLDAKAEAIAKQEEENQKMLSQIENQRKQGFYSKVEAEIKTGKIDNIPLSREDANSILNLLFAEDVRLKLPEGREVKMNAFEAEIFKHKYSNKGDVKLLLKAALLLTNPDKFYKHFANEVKTKETNEFVKAQKYNITKSQPKPETKKETKNVGWYRPK